MTSVIKQAQHVVKANSTAILTAAGISGTLTTAYLTGKASWRASEIVHVAERRGGTAETFKQRMKERVPLVWKLYIPPAIAGAATVGAILGATKLSTRRAAAAISAYSVTERAFSEYKEKVVEQIGVNKEQALRDEIAQAKVSERPPSSVIITDRGEVLCCELYTGRYFKSSMETLRRAQNDINHEMLCGIHASLADFYYMIDLPITTISTDVGWDNDRLMELKFTTTLSEDDKPCLAFEYNYVKPL